MSITIATVWHRAPRGSQCKLATRAPRLKSGDSNSGSSDRGSRRRASATRSMVRLVLIVCCRCVHLCDVAVHLCRVVVGWFDSLSIRPFVRRPIDRLTAAAAFIPPTRRRRPPGGEFTHRHTSPMQSHSQTVTPADLQLTRGCLSRAAAAAAD
jgi:hypothetical protein